MIWKFLIFRSVQMFLLYRFYCVYNYSIMIVLFLNLHKDDHQGKLRFQRFYNSIRKVLDQTIYYGTYFQEQIRTRETLDDFLYDDLARSPRERSKQKFKSVTYIFIDGPVNLPPWSPSVNSTLILIRNSLAEQKKVFFNGFGHLALYYFLSTGFDKEYCIRKKGDSATGKEDYLHDEQTGELYCRDKLVCNSGIQVLNGINAKFSQARSIGALEKGVVLPTKFHHLAFNSKNGDAVLKNIIFPFSFYEKHKVFCTPIVKSRANVVCLVESEEKIPIVYRYERCISTHLLCPETLKILVNWVTDGQQVKPFRQIKINQVPKSSQMSFQNLFSLRATQNQRYLTSSSPQTQRNASTQLLRPHTAAVSSSTKSKFVFDKPSVRCSGPYDTSDHIKTLEEMNSRKKLIGRSRMNFKSDMEKNQIQNYVQRTPSRPPSAHNFRDINKAKWVCKRTFFVT